eukprot:gene131-308_t
MKVSHKIFDGKLCDLVGRKKIQAKKVLSVLHPSGSEEPATSLYAVAKRSSNIDSLDRRLKAKKAQDEAELKEQARLAKDRSETHLADLVKLVGISCRNPSRYRTHYDKSRPPSPSRPHLPHINPDKIKSEVLEFADIHHAVTTATPEPQTAEEIFAQQRPHLNSVLNRGPNAPLPLCNKIEDKDDQLLLDFVASEDLVLRPARPLKEASKVGARRGTHVERRGTHVERRATLGPPGTPQSHLVFAF